MAQVNWSFQAIEDMDMIAEYISRDSYHYASVQLERFFEAVKVLETFPEFGKPVPEAARADIREIIIGSYRIIYRVISDDLLDVLTIHHSRR